MRKAMGLNALGRLLKEALVPEGDNKAVQYAVRYAPDALYAGLSALMAPEGTDLGGRLGIAAEDLALGLGGSVLGQATGLGAAKALRGKKLTQADRDIAATMGDLVVSAPINMLAPRPMFDAALQKAYQREKEQEAARSENEEQVAQEQLVNLLLGTGAIGGYALGAGGPVRLN